MKQIERIPRPMGVTALMVLHHQHGSIEPLQKAQTLIIQSWMVNKSEICGRTLNTAEVANFAEVPIGMVHNQMKEQLLSTRIWTNDNAQQITEALMGQAIAWAVEDRMDIQKQVDLLRESQGDKYVPFISSEVTKAIALKVTSSNTLQSLIKTLQGPGQTNIFTQNNTQINAQPGYTIEEVQEVIQTQLSHTTSTKDYIEVEYEEEEMPEVVATRQVGISTAKEGLNINRAELALVTDDYKGALQEADNLHHETRREIELMIDPLGEDPEAMNYVTVH